MGKKMRMEVWKEVGTEVSLEIGEGEKECEGGYEDGDENVGEDGGGRMRWGNR